MFPLDKPKGKKEEKEKGVDGRLILKWLSRNKKQKYLIMRK
jgi:hypothetical protein